MIGAVSLGSSCARPRARSAVTIACVAPNVSACGRSVHLGGGDAERAHICLLGLSETAGCNSRRDFRK